MDARRLRRRRQHESFALGDSLAENKVTFGCELVLAVVVVMDTEAAKGHVMVFVASPPNHSAPHSGTHP